MTKINKKELQKISYDFRSMASRVLNAHFNEVASIIGMLIAFIDKTPLLKSYIDSCPFVSSDEQIQEDIKAVIGSFGRNMLSTGNTPEEEVAYTYRLLKVVRENPEAIFMIGNGYCSSNKYQDMTKAFGNYIIHPFVDTIQGHLMHIGIDMGMDENNQYNITVSGGQVNISQDNSTLNAIQNNDSGLDASEIQRLIDSIIGAMNTEKVPDGQIDEIKDTLLCIKEELTKKSPQKSIVKMLLTGLQTTSTAMSAIPDVAQKVKAFATYVMQYLN